MKRTFTKAVVIAALGLLATAAGGDTVESTSGTRLEGKVISRDDKFVVIEVQVNGKPVQRKFALHLVRAITIDGVREDLKAGGGPKPAATGATAGQRSKAEIEKLIAEAGKTPPDWLESTKLNYPKTLDLSWPEGKPDGGWNNQKNVGQFYWDVINPNPGRWREGVKLMHHLMDMHRDDKDTVARAARDLGGMYHRLFQDYARSAYWIRQAKGYEDYVVLAECYFRLGNKQMAVELLNQFRSIPLSAVKLWADMGETDKALKLAELFAGGRAADEANLLAGDACRLAGRYAQALAYYNKVVAMPDTKDNKRNKDRATASAEAIKLFDTLDVKKVPDGTYKDSSLGYEGPIEVEVTVRGGRIEDVKVTKHKEKQFYASITDTPERIIRKQSVKGVDATSRATITSEAIINASAKALRSGQQQ
jgi:uncharacterized protein with FMN-binding domain